jgi:hypothetical protein
MGQALHIDPIAHAWGHCNPHTPLPSALVRRAAPYGLALSLYSSNRQFVAGCSSATQDTRNGFLTVAVLPLISSPMGD